MTTADYIIDSILVLLVLVQIRERPLTSRELIRPLIIVGIAVFNYLDGIPTQGNDLVLISVLAVVGLVIGAASGRTVIMRPGEDGVVLARAGWASACLWVLGMGSRFAFAWWASHGGSSAVADFSAAHSITGGDAWTAALLSMAVLEVLGRTGVLAARRRQLQFGRPRMQLA